MLEDPTGDNTISDYDASINRIIAIANSCIYIYPDKKFKIYLNFLNNLTMQFQIKRINLTHLT